MAPTISVVIATYNRSRLLATTLDSLAVQSWPGEDFEVIVSDNGSTDSTRVAVEAFARRRPACQYLSVPTPGKSHAINAALQLARGSVIAFTDDDVIASEGWLEGLAGAFRDTNADFVAGRIEPLWEAPPPAWMSPALYGVLAIPESGRHRLPITQQSGVMPIGANMAVRREVLDRLGGWRGDLVKLRGTLRTGEDHEFFLRMLNAGLRGVYEPSAVVRHLVPSARLRPSYFRKWFYQNGQDVAVIERQFPPACPFLLRVPRHLWRQAASDVIALGRGLLSEDARARVASGVRLLWLVGYARGAWSRAPGVQDRPPAPTVRKEAA